MKITVNAESREITTTILADALAELDFNSPAIATALNGIFVPQEDYSKTNLSQGDRLEVLAPMQGG
ncbi:sulfur carrier protein ThiS [Pseudovibrio axinellae]|uniref:Sulfur carrier protein ThiS n=1 Tax=Pseudovibrio axinellae TaxID=989403 RepID=A0A165UPG5_9HYPH|nr:sulfur carrier protein ThiS [Pseudovibrio axinellae]KZL12656.1 sulfur carrier protein ThiS [Pseudovibrio axinellae]SEP62723.1 sulfur carrier protein [Pseudovibrio axinellae]